MAAYLEGSERRHEGRATVQNGAIATLGLIVVGSILIAIGKKKGDGGSGGRPFDQL
jgi:hypothetical protein